MAHELIEETQAEVVAHIVAAAVKEAALASAQTVRETAIAAAQVRSNEDSSTLIEIGILKTEMNGLKNQINGFDSTFKEIFTELKELSKGRPSWSVTWIITILTSLCVGMGTFIATRVG